jgi:cardiolipin synthase A/B
MGDLFVRYWISIHGLLTLLALGVYLTASHSLRQRRHPSAAIAWLLSLALIPYLALPLYILLGNRKVVRRPAEPRSQSSISIDQMGVRPGSRFQILAGTLGLPPASNYDYFELHEDGSQARRSLISLIGSATATLDLCTFFLGHDALGREIAKHLIQKSHQGVRVRLMLDGLGLYLGGYPDLRPLRAAGIQVAKFVPLFQSLSPGRSNLRNHRKLVIADRERVWMGGRNLAAEYFEGDVVSRHKKSAWVDLSFEFHGAIAQQTNEQFDKDWAFAKQERPVEAALPAMTGMSLESSSVQLLPSGPDQSEDTIYTLLVSSCFAAQNRILAVSPYFVPDATLQMALTLAARRGIAVDLLLPRKSNHRLADLARHAALRELTSAGARVWLVPGMIHAKAIVIDDEVAMAGSANIDERSLFLNYELMVAFYRRPDVLQFSKWIEHQRQGAQLYKARQPGVLRELGEGAVRWLAFQL